jgi:hypothetical protein
MEDLDLALCAPSNSDAIRSELGRVSAERWDAYARQESGPKIFDQADGQNIWSGQDDGRLNVIVVFATTDGFQERLAVKL